MNINSNASSQSENLLQKEQRHKQTPQTSQQNSGQQTNHFKECEMIIAALGQLLQNRIQQTREVVEHQNYNQAIESILLAKKDLQLIEQRYQQLNQTLREFDRVKKQIEDMALQPRTDL